MSLPLRGARARAQRSVEWVDPTTQLPTGVGAHARARSGAAWRGRAQQQRVSRWASGLPHLTRNSDLGRKVPV